MNKKIIAIAIAAAMTAPVAMADIMVSGRMAGELVSSETDGTNPTPVVMKDSGMARIYFDATMGNAFAQMGYKSGFAGDLGAPADLREQYLGYKFDGFDLRAGRVQGVMYTLEGDKFKGTFVQMKQGASAVAFNDGFINASIQLNTKVAGGNLRVNYNPTSDTGANTGGNMGVSWKGKMGNVGVFAGYNNGADNESAGVSQSSMKIGASMKFGSTLVTAMLSNADDSGAETDGTLLMVNHDMGNGLSIDLGYGINDTGAANDTTQTRLVVQKQISKGVKVFGGFTSKDTGVAATDTTDTGVGMEVRF